MAIKLCSTIRRGHHRGQVPNLCRSEIYRAGSASKVQASVELDAKLVARLPVGRFGTCNVSDQPASGLQACILRIGCQLP